MLHITNGDRCAKLLEKSGVSGEVIPWRDVLHEGPVRRSETLEVASALRIEFLVSALDAPRDITERQFKERDRRFLSAADSEETVLWFEHDLYDQLQLLQILHGFTQFARVPEKLSLICINAFSGVGNFIGLGQLSPEQLSSLFPQRVPVTAETLQDGAEIFESFIATEPTQLFRMNERSFETLPFVSAALHRCIAEFPNDRNGLSLSEHNILSSLFAGPISGRELFVRNQAMEPAPYLGDSVFWTYLKRLSGGEAPAIAADEKGKTEDSAFSLTSYGLSLLKGESDWAELPSFGRDLGGTTLVPRTQWRCPFAARGAPARVVKSI